MSKDKKPSFYCRLRGGNENCSTVTYNKQGVCQNCRDELSHLLTKLEIAKELGIESDIEHYRELEPYNHSRRR
jgi:RNA polymerase subunit RPABC4/transcription elongation factor Spt4